MRGGVHYLATRTYRLIVVATHGDILVFAANLHDETELFRVNILVFVAKHHAVTLNDRKYGKYASEELNINSRLKLSIH
jgi:hypothetical protein